MCPGRGVGVGVRLGQERSLGRNVKGGKSGDQGRVRGRGAGGLVRRRGGSAHGALTGPMTHTMRSRSSRE